MNDTPSAWQVLMDTHAIEITNECLQQIEDMKRRDEIREAVRSWWRAQGVAV